LRGDDTKSRLGGGFEYGIHAIPVQRGEIGMNRDVRSRQAVARWSVYRFNNGGDCDTGSFA